MVSETGSDVMPCWSNTTSVDVHRPVVYVWLVLGPVLVDDAPSPNVQRHSWMVPAGSDADPLKFTVRGLSPSVGAAEYDATGMTSMPRVVVPVPLALSVASRRTT